MDESKPFMVRISARSTAPGIALIRKITTSGFFCPMPSVSKIACDTLKCHFHGTLCDYNQKSTTQDTNATFIVDSEGMIWLYIIKMFIKVQSLLKTKPQRQQFIVYF